MRWFKKKPEVWLLLGIIVAYFFLRIPNLTSQPIFADEAIYIRWAQIAKAEPTLRFISLQDGKTPLFMWLMAPFLVAFDDPLFAGRLLSIVSGAFTLLGVYFLTKQYFNLRSAFWAAFLIAITPYMIFFNRLALVDSMLAAFTVWTIYFGLKLTNQQNWKNSILLGIMAGAGWLTKTPGLVNLALLPLLVIFFNFKKPKVVLRLVSFGKYFVLAGVIAVAMYLIQRIDPNFHQLSSRNADYVHPVSRLLIYPFDPFIPHFRDTVGYFWSYFGLGLILLIPGALIMPIFKKNKVSLILLLWIALPFWFELQFIKAYTARYILFCVPPLLILIAWEIDELIKLSSKYFQSFMGKKYYLQLASGLIAAGLLIWPTFFISKLLTDPTTTPLSRDERTGYLEDWTAGYGFKEIAQYLQKESKDQLVIVGTEGGFGTLPEGLWIYLDKNKNVIFKPGKLFFPETIVDEAKNHPTYFVSNRLLSLTSTPSATILKTYVKPTQNGQEPFAIVFYQVKPK